MISLMGVYALHVDAFDGTSGLNVYAVSELCLIITLSLSATETPKLQFPPAPDPTTFEPTFRFVISINNLDKQSRCDSTLIVDRWIAPVS